MIKKERRNENVTSNRTRSRSADVWHRNRGADFEHCRRGRRRTRQVVRGGRVPTQADTTRNASWAVSRDKHADRVSSNGRDPAGSPSIMEVHDEATVDELDQG